MVIWMFVVVIWMFEVVTADKLTAMSKVPVFESKILSGAEQGYRQTLTRQDKVRARQ
jgi:hypothetical protein